jgi:hypothetical protein
MKNSQKLDIKLPIPTLCRMHLGRWEGWLSGRNRRTGELTDRREKSFLLKSLGQSVIISRQMRKSSEYYDIEN